MSRFFFTWGHGQYHGVLKNHYLEIQAPTEEAARRCMVEAFGLKWCGCYDEGQFENAIARFNLTRLAVMDEFGNHLRQA